MQETNLWSETSSASPEVHQMKGVQTCDVAIIGAGFTGLSAALHLSKAGVSVAVLEANHIGFGGSGRNVGLVNAGLWIKPSEVIERIGSEAGERIINFLGDAPKAVFDLVKEYQMDCEAHQSGTLHCAPNKSGVNALQERCAQWQERGAPVSLLSETQTQEKLGTSFYSAALLDERAGTVQPLSYAHGLAHAALSHGAKIFDHSQVLKAEQTSKGWKLTTQNGTLEAGKVLCATNAYTEGQAQVRPPQMSSLYYFQAASEPLDKNILAKILPEKQGAWDTHPVLTSFRLDDAGRMIIGSVGRLDCGGSVIHLEWARRALSKIYPALKDIKFSHQWCGRIGLTGDNIPRFSAPLPGWAVVWGYNGRGIGPGTVFGKALSEFLQTGHLDAMPLIACDVQADRFIKSQSFGIELGARAHHFIAARF